METTGAVTATQAKAILAELLSAGGGDPAEVARARGFEALADDSLVAVVAETVEANRAEWDRYLAGDDKLAGFFTGQIMKATRGKADGKRVAEELRRLRNGEPEA